MNKYSFITCTPETEKEEYEYFLSPSSELLQVKIDELESRNVFCYFDLKLPKSWKSFSKDERKIYFEETPIDIFINSIFFRVDHDGKDEDLKLIENSDQVDCLHIYYGDISSESLAILSSLSNLESLLLKGEQYDDSIIPYITKCTNLENIDLYDANISREGLDEIKKKLPKVNLYSN